MSAALLWVRLELVRQCTFRAGSEHEEGTSWHRRGEGSIRATWNGVRRLEWEETGAWHQDDGRPTPYRNRLRWEWDALSPEIRLYHLRRGPEHPIHLADLAPTTDDRFVGAAPHHCAPDLYRAELIVSSDMLELSWRVTGPAKDYSLRTVYSS
jgi:uncharacterized protein DUF6314